MNYLIYGEEEALISIKTNYIKKNITKNNELDFEIFEFDFLDETNYDFFVQEMSQISFSLIKKLIILNNCTFLTEDSKKNNKNKMLFNILNENINSTDNYLILKLISSKSINDSYFSLFDENNVFNIKKITKNSWPNLVKNYINKNNYKIDDDAIDEIINRCNYDFNIFLNEVNKLFIFCNQEKIIKLKDVLEIVSYNPENNIFNIINALILNDVNSVMNSYNDMKSLGIEPVMIINSLSSNLIFIDQVIYLYNLNKNFIEISEILHCNKFRTKVVIDNYKKNLSFSPKTLLNKLSILDKDIKLGNVDRFLGLEIFFANL